MKAAVYPIAQTSTQRRELRGNSFINTTWHDIELYLNLYSQIQPFQLVRPSPDLRGLPQPKVEHPDLIHYCKLVTGSEFSGTY
jgi:hypothetical protein